MKRRMGYEVSATRALGRESGETAVGGARGARTRPGRDECALAMVAWEDGSVAVWHLHERRSVAVTAPTSSPSKDDDEDRSGVGGVSLACAGGWAPTPSSPDIRTEA